MPCPKDHEEFGHKVSDASAFHQVNELVVTDSGCQSTAIPQSFANKVSFRRLEASALVVKRAIAVEFTCKDEQDNLLSTRQLCYVL